MYVLILLVRVEMRYVIVKYLVKSQNKVTNKH